MSVDSGETLDPAEPGDAGASDSSVVPETLPWGLALPDVRPRPAIPPAPPTPPWGVLISSLPDDAQFRPGPANSPGAWWDGHAPSPTRSPTPGPTSGPAPGPTSGPTSGPAPGLAFPVGRLPLGSPTGFPSPPQLPPEVRLPQESLLPPAFPALPAPTRGPVSTPPARPASRAPAARPARRWAAVGGVLVACLGVGAVVSGDLPGSGLLPFGTRTSATATTGAPLASPATLRTDGVSAAVAALGRAWHAGDETALIATVQPAGSPLAVRWRGMLRGTGRVGLAKVTFAVVPATVAGGMPLAGYDETAKAAVAMTYTLAPWDASPVTTVLGLTFARRGTQWVLVDDGDAATTLPLGGPYEPWLVGDVGVATRAHVLVVGDPGRSADNERLAGLLEKAVTSVRGTVTTSRWNGRVVAYASTDPTFVASWFGTRADTGNRSSGKEPATFAAEVRTLPTNVVASGTDVIVPATARVAVTPYLLSRGDSRARAVLRHEITHVALALEGQGAIPTWLVEGTAEYSAYRALTSTSTRSGLRKVSGVAALDQRGLPTATWQQLRRGTWKPTLPQTPSTFYTGTSSQVADAYTAAWLTCLYIASHYGEASLFALYSAAASSPVGQDATTVEASVLRQVLKTDEATLLRETTTYARGLRRSFA